MKSVADLFRKVWRMCCVLGVFLRAAVYYFFHGGQRWGQGERARWVSRYSRQMLKALGFQVEVVGPIPPEGGIILPNHLSYMDIIVFGSVLPQVFLSKKEVRSWPFIGAYTRMAGSLFIDRRKRNDVAAKDAEFTEVMQAGASLTIFLEGTTTNGAEILPYRSSLLEPMLRNGWQITPAYIRYESDYGDPSLEVCWWGDMTFNDHLFSMARMKVVKATVAFGESRIARGDRKELAETLRQETLALRATVEGQKIGATV